MRSSNPVFSSLTKAAQDPRMRGGYGGATPQAPGFAPNGGGAGSAGYYQSPTDGRGYGQAGGWQSADSYAAAHGAYAPPTNAGVRALTVDDVVTKTGITLAVIVVAAIVNFFITMHAPGLGMLLMAIGGLVGFVTVMFFAFARSGQGSKTLTLFYAVCEGLFVGGASFMFVGFRFGGAPAYDMILQAILGTVGVFAGMLYAYKSGAIKVTSRVRRGVTAALFGVLALMIGSFVVSLFTGHNPLYSGGLIAIIFSLVCIGVAAASFLLDFDNADRLVRAGAPANYAWGIALGLAVTLVWCYIEILRLLSMLQRN